MSKNKQQKDLPKLSPNIVESPESKSMEEGSKEHDSVLLGFFWDLTSVDVNVRNNATKSLIDYLIPKQSQFQKTANKEASSKISLI